MNAPTSPPRKRAPGAGRKPISADGDTLVPLNSKVFGHQKVKFKELGGSAWLRGAIDAAQVPEKSRG